MSKYSVPEFISNLSDQVGNNTSGRFDCPGCYGKHTLSITKSNGKLKYHCFKLQCKVKGRDTYLNSVQSIKEDRLKLVTNEKFILPEGLVYGVTSEKCQEQILKTHSIEPYKRGLFNVAYDPAQDRVCYVVKSGKDIVGLIGRAVKKNATPKTLNYKNSDKTKPFIVGSTETVVLTEDCASAASIARIESLSGLALLGTTLKTDYIPSIIKFKNIIIALDRDARKKALAIKLKLGYYTPQVSIWWLNKDIKDTSDEDLLLEYRALGDV